MMRAVELDRLGVQRERRPNLMVELGGDYGQRARPGEERALGVGGRGDAIARVNWVLLESGRKAREMSVAHARAAIEELTSAFDIAYRANVARAYIASSIARERLEAIRDFSEALEHISNAVELRVELGVESVVSSDLVAQSYSSTVAKHREIESSAGQSQLELDLLAGRTSSPLKVKLIGPSSENETYIDNPALSLLDNQIRELRAEAEATEKSGRWRIEAVGWAGPHFSRAFDDSIQEEYTGGLRLVWNPDLAGVNRARSQAAAQRASAIEMDRASLEMDIDRDRAMIQALTIDLPEQTAEWDAAMKRAKLATNTARMRWTEGYGSWKELLATEQKLLDMRLDEVDWRESLAMIMIDFAERSGAIDSLPMWIGQREGAEQ